MKKDYLYPLRRIHGMLYDRACERKVLKVLKDRIHNCSQDTILLVFTPAHGNLGDHAITLADLSFIRECNRTYLEITDKELALLYKYNSLYVLNGFPIVFHGGGYIGTLWMQSELLVKAIIKAAPDSNILFCPNTAYFEDSKRGKKEYAKFRQLVLQHRNLRICAREKYSYELLRKMGAKVELIPDVVFNLNMMVQGNKRSGALLCLRGDIEKTISPKSEEQLRSKLKAMFGGNVFCTDTVLDKGVTVSERENEVRKKLEEFAKAELVITDRLHGMIFAAITSTPCILINSLSPKVLGCYEWIKDLGYVKVISDFETLDEVCHEVISQTCIYENHKMQEDYARLKRFIADL